MLSGLIDAGQLKKAWAVDRSLGFTVQDNWKRRPRTYSAGWRGVKTQEGDRECKCPLNRIDILKCP